MPGEDGILDVEVSFDGSWQKRGHKSHIGVGAVIEFVPTEYLPAE